MEMVANEEAYSCSEGRMDSKRESIYKGSGL